MEPFKNIYNSKSIGRLAQEIKIHCPEFRNQEFKKRALVKLTQLEMKERVIQIAEALHHSLPGPETKNIRYLVKSMKSKSQPNGIDGFMLWPYSYYIETYGIDHFDVSMKALYELTQRFTAEFGIRPFLENEPDQVYKLLKKWAGDKNEHVRRLVSEGTRPNLPWGKKVSHLPKNLAKNLQLLELLKEDPSEYVRKSVANHLNDISRLDPKLAVRTAKKWSKIETVEMNRIIKQALRSLLKQGDSGALALLGYKKSIPSKVTNLKISKSRIKEGESFEAQFILTNQAKKTSNFMVDYSIHYPKANGKLSEKTFKLKVLSLDGNQKTLVRKKISFKKVTTRRHYPGKHLLEIKVNGVVKARNHFLLL